MWMAPFYEHNLWTICWFEYQTYQKHSLSVSYHLLCSLVYKLKIMKLNTILSFTLGALMVGGFLVQMWEIFIQFHNELKTIAVSFEEKAALEFPSIAICDSRAFTELSTMTANAMRYNSTTFSVEGQISLKIRRSFKGSIRIF